VWKARKNSEVGAFPIAPPATGFSLEGKKVAVVGGGDAAVKEGIYLAGLAEEVVIIHRRDQFRAAGVLSDKVKSLPNVRIVWDSVVDEIVGDKRVEGIRIHNVKTQQSSLIQVAGVFMYVGIQPNTAFLEGIVQRDPARVCADK
jgi:thioredoxin reductase (NADPH)